MSLNHQDATAKIRIDGLAICCFNKKERLWEVGFMRHQEHELIIRWADGRQALAVPAEARVIRIETENGETRDYDKEFSEGFFDAGPVGNRKRDPASMTTEERENFRWAMNLDEGADVPHGTITIKPPPYPVTMVYISDAVFYTNAITPENMFLVPLPNDPNTMSPEAVDQRLYGKTADEIGVDIKCSAGGRIKITVQYTVGRRRRSQWHDFRLSRDGGGGTSPRRCSESQMQLGAGLNQLQDVRARDQAH
jgi:hypothetical protein